jgi:hypothetical protein
MGPKSALVIAAALVAASVAIGGVYSVTTGGATNPAGGVVYVVNRFTGFTWACSTAFCRPLQKAMPTNIFDQFDMPAQPSSAQMPAPPPGFGPAVPIGRAESGLPAPPPGSAPPTAVQHTPRPDTVAPPSK